MDSNSILETIRRSLVGFEDSDEFDVELMLFINNTLSTLNQLGVGPAEGYMVDDAKDTWSNFVGDDNVMLGFVKTYVLQKTKLNFDPPSSGAVIEALKQSIAELEWRIEYRASATPKNVVG